MKSHATASLYIFNSAQTRILLIKHKKLGQWFPTGGHVDNGELPHEAAMREATEEANIQNITLLNPSPSSLTFESEIQRTLPITKAYLMKSDKPYPLPFLLFEEKIPANSIEEEHVHIDHIYVGKINKPQGVIIQSEEILDEQWVKLDEQTIQMLETFDQIKVTLRELMSLRYHK